MFCGKCGASVPDGEEMCPFCGERARGGAIVVAEKTEIEEKKKDGKLSKLLADMSPKKLRILLCIAAALVIITVLVIVIASCTAVDPESIAKDAVEAYMNTDADDYFELYDEDYLRRYYEYNYEFYLALCEKQNVKSDWASFDDFYDDLMDARENNFAEDIKPDKEKIADKLDSDYTKLDYEIDEDSIKITELGSKSLKDWQEKFDLVNFHGELTEGVRLRMTVAFISDDGDQSYDVKMDFIILKVNDEWYLFRCDKLYRAQDSGFMFD